MVLKYVFFILLAQFLTIRCNELSENSIGELLLTFERYINASISMERTDRELVSNWTTEYQVKQVNITSHYRLDMTRHGEHSFRGKKTNPKWRDCISLHEHEIKKSKVSYFDGESECLKIANSADKDQMQAVHQVQKEIRKWRKSYRYLSNICNTDNPDDKDAANLCLVQYVKKDNYDVVLQRLLILKLEAMEQLLERLNNALTDLEGCLKHRLADFLNTIRNIMDNLAKCYSTLNRE